MNVLFISVNVLNNTNTNDTTAPNQTVRAYTNAGWKVHIITNGCRLTPLGDQGFEEHRVLTNVTPKMRSPIIAKFIYTVIFPVLVFLVFLRLRKTTKFHVIYGYEIYGVIAGFFISKFARIPLVARFQGTILHPILKQGTWLQKLRKFDHLLALSLPADLVIMTNDGTKGDQVVRQLRPNNKVVFWKNGVDSVPEQTSNVLNLREKFPGTSNPIVLMTLSRIAAWKRIDRAIDVCRILRKKGHPVVLAIFGEGEERKSLENDVAACGNGDFIKFFGSIEHSEVSSFMRQADIFLSLYDLSNLGNPLFEAMMVGKPIVTLNNGETGKVIQDGVNGLLLPENAPISDIAIAVEKLIENPSFRQHLSSQAQLYAKTEFRNWTERMNEELQVVTSLLDSRWHRQV